jgi:hypothetical protein
MDGGLKEDSEMLARQERDLKAPRIFKFLVLAGLACFSRLYEMVW